MSGLKESARAGADRLVKPYLQPLAKEVGFLRDDVGALVTETRDRLGLIEAHARANTDEVRGLRGSTDLRLDHTNLRLHQVLDEVGGIRDRLDRVEEHFDNLGLQLNQRLNAIDERASQLSEGLWERWALVQEHFDNTTSRLVGYLEDQAQRQSELRAGLEEVVQANREALEKLELLMMTQLEGLFGAVNAESTSLRADVVELTRMLRMQGDASDQVAEVMGRTLTRLSAEVEMLGSMLPTAGDEVAAARS